MKNVLITGSLGLIGSQACEFFHNKGFNIIGIDNDMRSYFFGSDASTKKNLISLNEKLKNFKNFNCDIRNFDELKKIFKKYNFEIIIHTAAQPSHDWAAKEPLTDFHINASGTLNLLELCRLYSPESTFIFTSTNKVYGDRPNLSYLNNYADKDYKNLRIIEEETRWEGYFNNSVAASIDEGMSIDDSKHSIFGASKLSADIMCQEYGKYFNMKVGVFRGGCLTGPDHAGAELHGFLSYLIKCMISNRSYTIFGYKGKQVRDNIHSYDLITMFWEFYKNPKCGEVYNAGGGRENSISIIEAIKKVNKIGNKEWRNFEISKNNRIGDHVWYISDLTKFKKDYPNWKIKYGLNDIIDQMVYFEKNR